MNKESTKGVNQDFYRRNRKERSFNAMTERRTGGFIASKKTGPSSTTANSF
jgi:hypothetical protein